MASRSQSFFRARAAQTSRSLWHNPDFLKLWLGQTVSEFGSRISRDGIPLIAVIVLTVSPAELGLLTTITSLPTLLFGLFAGVWVDRLPRRRLMIAADVLRLLLLLSVPVLAVRGQLTFTWVCVIAASMALLGWVFDLAYRALLPTVIDSSQLLEGNTKLATTEALAEIGGPSVAGGLIQIFTAPLAMLFDALTFLVSIISLTLIRTPEPKREPAHTDDAPSLRRELLEGIMVIWQHPVLRPLAIGLGLRSFFGSFFAALYGLYALRELNLAPAQLGFLIACGGIGALAGTAALRVLMHRFSLGRLLTVSLLVSAGINLLIPLAALAGTPIAAMLVLIIAQIVGDGAMTVYTVQEMTLRQSAVDERLLGRANASFGFLAECTPPLGGLVAGLLGTLISTTGALAVACVGILCVAVYTLRSPARFVVQPGQSHQATA
jgi:predicted MFS family arabinose efflux permease